jgi:hypothetical protein
MSGSQNFFWEADPVGPARIFLFLLEVDSIYWQKLKKCRQSKKDLAHHAVNPALI